MSSKTDITNRPDLKDLSLEELEAHLTRSKEQAYRAKQIFEWVYKKFASDFAQMSDLPLSLRELLQKKFRLSSCRLIEKKISALDSTRKYLFRLEDGETVETVLIPTEDRQTACLSSQVGCAFACKFCASGLAGIKRDLRCGEILDQALGIAEDIGRLTNIVVMGTGEPLANYDNVMKAISVMNSPYGFGIGARKITISTAGYIPGIKRLMGEEKQIELSVSLHAATDKARSYLMPINKKYPLSELMAVCRDYVKKKKRIITFEYVLIGGINASREDALSLCKLLKGILCKVNLIRFNRVSGLDFAPPSQIEVKQFHSILRDNRVNSTIRAQRGADIDAACGQLRLREIKKNNKEVWYV